MPQMGKQERKQYNKDYWQRYYQLHKQAILAKNRAWNASHPEATKSIRLRYEAKER